MSDPRLTPARRDLAAAHLRGTMQADRYVEGKAAHIVAEVADVRHAPTPDAPLDTQALHGEPVTVYEDEEGWNWVQLARDGYVGYVAANALAPGHVAPTHRVAVGRSFIYPTPNMKAPVLGALPLGGVVRVTSVDGGYARLAAGGFVFAAHLCAFADRVGDFVGVAERLLGTPYLWGGKSPFGLDCSGLVQIALAEAGIAAPRDTDLQKATLGAAVPVTDDLVALRRGDLVFWAGHVGIMRDAQTLIHANAHHMLVASEPLRTARDRILLQAKAPIAAITRLG